MCIPLCCTERSIHVCYNQHSLKCIHTGTHAHVCPHTHRAKHAHMHTHVHTRMHTHTHTNRCLLRGGHGLHLVTAEGVEVTTVLIENHLFHMHVCMFHLLLLTVSIPLVMDSTISMIGLDLAICGDTPQLPYLTSFSGQATARVCFCPKSQQLLF